MGRQATTAKALFWSGSDALLRQAASFGSTIILARLLLPEAFGAIATLQVLIGIADAFVSSGLPGSLMRSMNTTREEESSVFYFNLTVSILFAGLICLGAPQIAAFFGDPSLRGLTYAMALNLVLTATGTVHRTLLERSLDFRTITRTSFLASAISSTVAITMAYRGFGVWSLAAQALVSTAVSSFLLWKFHAWRPVRRWDLMSLKKHLRFGVYLLMGRLLDVGAFHANTILIAKFFSTRELAFFTRAQGTHQLPSNLMTSVLSRVALPVFASVAKSPDQLVQRMRRAQDTLMWINVPAMLGVAVIAEPLVLTLFGENWRPSIPILQVLALGGLVLPMRVLNANVHLALGHSKLMFQIGVVKRVARIALTVAASFHGILAMAWAEVIGAWIEFAINSYCTGKLIEYGLLVQLKDSAGHVLLSLLMAGTLLLLAPHLGATPWVRLIALASFGALFYGATSWLLRIPAAKEVIDRLGLGNRAGA